MRGAGREGGEWRDLLKCFFLLLFRFSSILNLFFFLRDLHNLFFFFFSFLSFCYIELDVYIFDRLALGFFFLFYPFFTGKSLSAIFSPIFPFFIFKKILFFIYEKKMMNPLIIFFYIAFFCCLSLFLCVCFFFLSCGDDFFLSCPGKWWGGNKKAKWNED